MSGKTSHKANDLSENKILNFYYTSRPFLFFMCAGNESFYSFLYLCHFTYGPAIPLINLGLFQLICLISAPICLVKTAISVIHLVAASYNIASMDVSERNK